MTDDTREALTRAIVGYARKQSPAAVQHSHDEARIYYAGLSIAGLVDAIDTALSECQAAPPQAQEPVAWPVPVVTNPDIADPTGVPYLDCLIHRVLDVQQDINVAANEGMDQRLCDAAALLDEIESALRLAASPPAVPAGAVTREEIVDHIKARITDLRAANEINAASPRDYEDRIQRNNREIMWLNDFRSMVSLLSRAPSDGAKESDGDEAVSEDQIEPLLQAMIDNYTFSSLEVAKSETARAILGLMKSDGRPKTQRAITGNMPRSMRGEEGGSSSASGFARSTVKDAALERHAGVVTRPSDTNAPTIDHYTLRLAIASAREYVTDGTLGKTDTATTAETIAQRLENLAHDIPPGVADRAGASDDGWRDISSAPKRDEKGRMIEIIIAGGTGIDSGSMGGEFSAYGLDVGVFSTVTITASTHFAGKIVALTMSSTIGSLRIGFPSRSLPRSPLPPREGPMGSKLTARQIAMICGSEPDDITGEEGVGVQLQGSGDYAVARSLLRKRLGYIDTPGFTTYYFNNADGLRCRAALEATKGGD